MKRLRPYAVIAIIFWGFYCFSILANLPDVATLSFLILACYMSILEEMR